MPERLTAPDAYPLDWPAGWPRTPPHKRHRSQFKLTEGVARDELLKELRRLGGRMPIISTNVPFYERGGHKIPYANMKTPDDPGVAVYFTHGGEQRVIACDRWPTIRENLNAIRLTVNALRGLDRWGSTDIVNRAFTGFRALPAAAAPADWRTVLHVQPGGSLSIAEAMYRRLARDAHPDRGGSNEAMARLNAAIRQAREELAGEDGEP